MSLSSWSRMETICARMARSSVPGSMNIWSNVNTKDCKAPGAPGIGVLEALPPARAWAVIGSLPRRLVTGCGAGAQGRRTVVRISGKERAPSGRGDSRRALCVQRTGVGGPLRAYATRCGAHSRAPMEAHTKSGLRDLAIGSRIVKPCTDLERCARRIAISRLDASAAERHDVVSLTRPAAAGPYSVLGSPIGLVVAELDQATPLASRLNRVIRQSVLLPSVAHKAARDAPDVHDVSVSVYVLLRQKQVTLADVVPGREARLRLTREATDP